MPPTLGFGRTRVENGAALIESAGIGVRKAAIHKARTFGASPGAVSGSVRLVTAAVATRASCEWEYSADGGKTWVAAAPSLQAKTTVTGLPSGTLVQFRVRPVTKAGPQDWSQPTSILVK